MGAARASRSAAPWRVEFIITEERNANEFVITRDTSWKAMLGKDEREATEEEIAAIEAEHGPFLPAGGEG
jgi:hypothetical protein